MPSDPFDLTEGQTAYDIPPVKKPRRRRTAPVAPIATQETVEEIARRCMLDGVSLAPGESIHLHGIELAFQAALRAERSSAERRIEELVREGQAFARAVEAASAKLTAAESRLASLTGQVEDMRERAAKEIDSWDLSIWDDANELTHTSREVEEMVADHRRNLVDAIRSLPVLPTTGDGGGPGAVFISGWFTEEWERRLANAAPNRPGDKRGGDAG